MTMDNKKYLDNYFGHESLRMRLSDGVIQKRNGKIWEDAAITIDGDIFLTKKYAKKYERDLKEAKEMLKIPNKVDKYDEDKESGCEKTEYEECFVYEPNKGEKINVVAWIKYPSYDFIFGYPDRTNPKAEKEAAFFQFRDTRTKKIKSGFYLDAIELDEVINGFSLIKKHGRNVERTSQGAKSEKIRKVANQNGGNSRAEKK